MIKSVPLRIFIFLLAGLGTLVEACFLRGGSPASSESNVVVNAEPKHKTIIDETVEITSRVD